MTLYASMRPTQNLAVSLLLACLIALCPIKADEEAAPEAQNRMGSDFIFKLLPTPSEKSPSEALPTQSNGQDLEVYSDGGNEDPPTITTTRPVTTTSIATSTEHFSSYTEKIKHYAPRPRLPASIAETNNPAATTSSLTSSKKSFIFTLIRTTLSTTPSKPSYKTDHDASNGDSNSAAGSTNLGKKRTTNGNYALDGQDGLRKVQTTIGYLSTDIAGGGKIGSAVWEYWYWILIGILLFIFLLLIPCFVCLICKQKRKRKYAEENDPEDTSEESHSPSKPQEPSKSSSGNSSSESQNNEPHSAANSKGSTIVITIPETKQYGFENPRQKPDDEPKMEDRTYSEPYDVRLEIGNETIIKSSEVPSPPAYTMPPPDRLMILQETPKINLEDTRKRTKRRHRHEKTGHKRTEVPDSRYRKRSPERPQSKSRTSRTKNISNRSDTKSKLSSQTKSIIEAAKDLDGILAAITSLTHEYPIPEYSNPSKNKSTTKKRHSSRTRHVPADTPAAKRSEGAKKHGDKKKHSKSRKDKDRKSRRRSKKKEPSGEKRKPKPDGGEADSSNKVPTLVKEELPAMDALKSEERRRRLERDLKKLQRYHNKHLTDS